MPDYLNWLVTQDWTDPLTDWVTVTGGGTPSPAPSAQFTPAEVWDPPRLRAAIHTSHTVVTRARVMEGRHAGTPLRILGGTVTVDLTQSVRRSANVTLVDPTGDLVVDDTNDLLAPLGPEVFLERGVRFTDGSEMYVGLGVFGIYDVDTDTGPDGTEITLQLYDRSRRLAENAWLDPYQVTGGIDFADAIEELITNRMQKAIFADFRFQPTGHLTGPNFIYGADNSSGDPNQDVQRMAGSIGFEIVSSPLDGVWELRPVARKTDPIVDVYAPGEAKLLGAKKNWTREDTYSIVKVTGERTGHAPVQSVARDDDPESPTYYKGLFGPKTFIAPTSEFITTQAQADAAAESWLARKAGASELLEFDAVVDPLLDAGDVIRVENDAAKVNARYLLESFTIPLSATEPMRATCRKRRVTS